jgi:hypothetical protein
VHYAKTACQRKQSHNTSTNIHHTNINKQLATQVDPITRHKRLTISPCLFTRKPFDGCRVYQMSHEYLRFCHRRRSPRTGKIFEAVLFLAVAHTACTLFHSNESSVLQLQGESLEAPITSLSLARIVSPPTRSVREWTHAGCLWCFHSRGVCVIHIYARRVESSSLAAKSLSLEFKCVAFLWRASCDTPVPRLDLHRHFSTHTLRYQRQIRETSRRTERQRFARLLFLPRQVAWNELVGVQIRENRCRAGGSLENTHTRLSNNYII